MKWKKKLSSEHNIVGRRSAFKNVKSEEISIPSIKTFNRVTVVAHINFNVLIIRHSKRFCRTFELPCHRMNFRGIIAEFQLVV